MVEYDRSSSAERGAVGEALDRRLAAVMFSDMVGYTSLIQADERTALEKRSRYWAAVEEHHDRNGGTIVQRLGDGSMSMFPSALSAVQAAVGIQRSLCAQDVAVRLGIHVGEVILDSERLTGEAVNVAARVESFATPGAVVLSDSAYEQVRNRSDVSAVALGRFRLKNVGRPFELYAVAGDGLVVPDPVSLEGKGERFATFRGSLPDRRSPLVGRQEDLDRLVELTEAHRVVTITGPGGVGKTSVLIELGRRLAPDFVDDMAFVALADIGDPSDVLPAIAAVLDVKEAEGRSLGEGVMTLIGDRPALLLLDNLEQVVDAAADLASLVGNCQKLRMVTTSRTPLRIAAEQEYALSPLPIPPACDATSIEPLEACSSVALFVERARTSNASFRLDGRSAGAVAAICRRLDGLPLALELAAARLRLLSPDALLERLDRALDVLTSAQRDTPARHQTLRATIAWSHSQLSAQEQCLFRRLAVFAGGCAIADVEAVCADQGDNCLDQLESLVDKALVQLDGQDGRLRLLQTIGAFAREQLQDAGEAGAIAMRHARRYAERACEIRDGMEDADQVASLQRGVAEEGNLHAAIETLLETARAGDSAAAQLGMQMCGDLWMYWHVRGKNVTASEYARAFLELDVGPMGTVARAGALITTGLTAWMLGEYAQSLDEFAEAYRIATEVGAQRETCIAGFMQALALIFLDPELGLKHVGESIERSRDVGFTWSEALGLTIAGILHGVTSDPDAAQTQYSKALEIQRRLGDWEGAGMSLGGLAELASGRGDSAAALELYRESLAAFEAVGDRGEEARILSETAWAYVASGDPVRARATFFKSVQAHTDLASVRGVGLSLIGLAATEVLDERPENAVRIAAAAEVYAKQEGIAVIYSDDTPGREYVEKAHAALVADDVAQAVEDGRKLTIKEVLDLAEAPHAAG